MALPLRILVGLAALLVLAAPAEAGLAPQFYFLTDAPSDVPVVPTPAGPVGGADPTSDGVLVLYNFKAPNLPNSTAPQTRQVFPATDAVAPVRFLSEAEGKLPSHIVGRPALALWTGPSPVLHANLTVILYEAKADGSFVELTSGSIAMDADLNKTPNPITLVPPTPNPDPAHPEQAAEAIAFYELAQASPMVLHPPQAIVMKAIDKPFDPTSRLALGFRLDPNPAPTSQNGPVPPLPGSPAPVPVGASVQLQYNGLFMPSYLYVPWFADPVATTTTSHTTGPTSATGCTTNCPTSAGTTSADATSSAKKSPGLPLLVGALAVAGVALLARRRMA